MNERIQELIKQAENYAAEQNDKFGVSYKKEYNQKFAELIVRECINKQLSLVSNYETLPQGYEPAFPEFLEGAIYGLKEGIELITQHFGIE